MTERFSGRSNLHKVLMVYSSSDSADKERFQEREIFILDLYHIILTRKNFCIFFTFQLRYVTKQLQQRRNIFLTNQCTKLKWIRFILIGAIKHSLGCWFLGFPQHFSPASLALKLTGLGPLCEAGVTPRLMWVNTRRLWLIWWDYNLAKYWSEAVTQTRCEIRN